MIFLYRHLISLVSGYFTNQSARFTFVIFLKTRVSTVHVTLAHQKVHRTQRPNLCFNGRNYKLWLIKSFCKPVLKSLFSVPPVYPDLSTCHDWSVKKAIVVLQTQDEGKFETPFWPLFGNFLSPLGTRNNLQDLGAVSQTRYQSPQGGQERTLGTRLSC